MPDWSSFKQKYVIEPDDLPNPHGPNLVVIETIDTEEYEDPKTKERKLRHNLYFAGWDKPLRLNNTRIDIIKQIFGPETEQAIGGKIALLVGMSSAYGETKPTIMIHPYQPNQDAEPAPVPDRCATRSTMRLAQAREYGVPFAPAQKRLAGGSAAPSANAAAVQAPGVSAGGDKKLGYETAAEICLLLRERNRDWDWLKKHMESSGMAALVAAELPPECPHALRAPAWSILKNLPLVNQIADRDAAKQRLINGWKPTLAQEAAKVAADDDIPF